MASGSGTVGKIDLSGSFLVPAIQFFLLAILFWLSLGNGSFIYDSDATPELYIFTGTLIALPLLTYAFRRLKEGIGLYLNSLELLLYLLLIPLFIRNPAFAILVVLPLVLSLLKFNDNSHSMWPYWKAAIFVSISLLMYFLGGFLQIIAQPASAPVVITPLTSIFIFPGQNLPVLFSYGFTIYGSYVTMTLSPLSLAAFTLIAALVSENYHGFFRILGGNGKGNIRTVLYGVTAALSCQCEACISLLPAMLFVIVTIAMIPLIVESVLLLLLSYAMIRLHARHGKLQIFSSIASGFSRIRLPMVSALLLSSSPLLIAGLYLGWFSNPIFFFGMGMTDTLTGYLLVLSIPIAFRRSRSNARPVLFIILASVMSFMWYFPQLTYHAYDSGAIFSIMVALSLASGAIYGVAHRTASRGYLVSEAVSLLYGIFVIVLFYFTVDYRTNPWGMFTYTQTVIFEIISWAIMLPVMWYFTQLSIFSSSLKKQEFLTAEPEFYRLQAQ